MVRKIISSQFKAGNGSGLFRHPLLRLGAVTGVVGVVLVVTLLVASSSLAARRSATSDAGVQYLRADKTCNPTGSSTPPFIICVVSGSNVALLNNASIGYVSNPYFFSDPVGGHLDSDVVLTTAEAAPSTAYGHCTFYFATDSGLCTFSSGTNSLAGFHAKLMIGPTLSNGAFASNVYSVIGQYWFDDNNNG